MIESYFQDMPRMASSLLDAVSSLSWTQVGATAVVAVAAVLVHHSAFNRVRLVRRPIGPLRFLRKRHVGSLNSIGKAFDRTKRDLAETALPLSAHMGLYFDGPDVGDKARAYIGASVAPEATKKQLTSALEELGDEWDVLDFPATPSLVWTFPYVSTLSFMIGAMKFYPAVMKSAELCESEFAMGQPGQNNPGIFELYPVDGSDIVFAVPKENWDLVRGFALDE